MIGCDGIFERLNNRDVIDTMWERIAEQTSSKTFDALSPQMQNIKGNPKKFANRG